MKIVDKEDKKAVRWFLTIGAVACKLIGGDTGSATKAIVDSAEAIADELMKRMPDQET